MRPPAIPRKPDSGLRHSFPLAGYKASKPGVPKSSLHRTESHRERFNSARAMFERMCSGDDLLGESRTDSESGLSSPYSYTASRSRSTSPLSPSRSSSVSSVNQDSGWPGRGVNWAATNGDHVDNVSVVFNAGHENGDAVTSRDVGDKPSDSRARVSSLSSVSISRKGRLTRRKPSPNRGTGSPALRKASPGRNP